MFAILTGTAALLYSLILAWQLMEAGLLLAACGAVIGGFCTLALLKVLTDIADHLEDIRRK